MDRADRLRRWLTNGALLVTTLLVLVAVIEVTLRASGFSYVLYPEDIEFGRPDPVMLKAGFLEDNDLFWVKKSYFEELQQLTESQPSLLFLGDSCTHLGHYDEALAELAEEHLGQRLKADVDYGNLAVAGWSSYQGRRQVERDVEALGADVATIYFGWNDHWIGFGIEDKNVARVKKVFGSKLNQSRFVQLITKAMVAYGSRSTDYPNRVSIDDFRANLTTMVEELRRQGTVPVLLTAPSGHVRGQEPKALEERWLLDLEDLIPLHQSYVQAVRDVAERLDAPLCDLELEMSQRPDRAGLWQRDGIHLTAEGDRVAAAVIFDCLQREQLWPLIVQ